MILDHIKVCSYLRSKTASVLQGCTSISRPTSSSTRNSVVRTAVPNSVLQYYPSKSLPSFENVVLRNGYLSSLSYRSKIPNWVAEKFSVESESGTSTRQGINFTDDVEVPLAYRVWKNDFFNTKYSRGHMAAAALHKGSKEEQQHTFYYNDNILPQDFSNNACDWYRLELLSRRIGHDFKEVHIISGPLWLPNDMTTQEMQSFTICTLPEVGKQTLPHRARKVEYDVIGRCMIDAPTHLYKIIACQGKLTDKDTTNSTTSSSSSSGGGKYIGVFITPNAPEHIWKPLASFKVPLDFVEANTGLNFNGLIDHVLNTNFDHEMKEFASEANESLLHKKRRDILEKHDLCSCGFAEEPSSTRSDMRLVGARYNGKMSVCKSLGELEAVWAEMGRVDKCLHTEQLFGYNKRLKELTANTKP